MEIFKNNELFHEIKQRWQGILTYIRTNINHITENEFGVYFETLKPYRLCDDRLYILCDRFEDLYRYENWHRHTVRLAIRQMVDGTEVSPVFITEDMVNTEGIFTLREKAEKQIPPRIMNLLLKDFYSHMEYCDDLHNGYDILNLIPSRDMRHYLKEIQYTFSEEERLAVIRERTYTWEDQKSWLDDLIATSKNRMLAENVERYISAQERFIKDFKTGDCSKEIYRTVLYYSDRSEKGLQYSRDYNAAYEYGKQFQESFYIEKLKISEVPSDMDDDPLTEQLSFDASGHLKVPTPFNMEAYDFPDIFESNIMAPHPFKNGDIVKVLKRYDSNEKYYAVVNEGEPHQYYENVAFDEFIVFVESYFPEDMEFGHDHVSPFDMEFCREPEMLEYPSILECAQALLTQKRRATLEEFTMQLHRQGAKDKDGI